MQNAKDSFYEVLRGRLAELAPERTLVIRGVTRPALMVDENETQSVAELPECFHLRWLGVEVNTDGPLPRVALQCELCYETAGSAWNGGMDRGRVLAAMDADLVSALTASPQNAPKVDYSGLASGGSSRVLNTRIWWGEPVLGEIKINHERIGRSVTTTLMSFLEQGEV